MDKKLKIIIENCPQNHKWPAVKVCPVGALSQKDFKAPKIDYDKCIKCGKCSILINGVVLNERKCKIF